MHQNARSILILIILNFVGCALSLLSVGRGVVNLDYFVSLFITNKIFCVFYLFLASIVDLFISYAGIFHFTPISFLENYKVALNADYKHNLIAAVSAFLILALLLVATKKIADEVKVPNKGKRLAGSVLITVLMTFDALLGTFNSNGLKYNSLLPNPLNINISTSGFVYLASEFRERYFYSHSQIIKKPVESAADAALNNLDSKYYPEKIVLIIIESYGLFKNRDIQNYMIKEFNDSINVKKTVLSGEIPFAGATTSGEIRELCGIKGDYKLALRNFDASQCLPNRLKRIGYDTSGFHYYYRSAFNRSVWWPIIGLNDLNFLDAYRKKSGADLCGGFLNGGCDKDLIDDLFAFSDGADEKTFSYGLTLNSHLPIHDNKYILKVDVAEINQIQKLPDSINSLVSSWRVVMKAVSDNINSRPNSDMLIVIVGDHSPPFLLSKYRGLFSDTHVPYIIVKTNNMTLH